MKKSDKRGKKKSNVLHIAASFVIIAIIPFIVSAIFKIHPHHNIFSAEWTPDGYLGYIGSLIGAVATIYAVRITIINERRRQEEERIISAQPWLVSETLLLCSNETICKEENGATTFVSLNGKIFGSSKEPPQEIKNGSHEINKTDCVIRYEIMNVGGDTATQLKLTLDEHPLFPDFALAKGQAKKIIFVLPLRTSETKSKYVLKFSYGDVVSPTRYLQSETLNIVQAEHGVMFSQNMNDSVNDLLSAPKKDNENGQDEI